MNNGTLEQGREGSLERESLEILHDGEQLAGGRHEKGWIAGGRGAKDASEKLGFDELSPHCTKEAMKVAENRIN